MLQGQRCPFLPQVLVGELWEREREVSSMGFTCVRHPLYPCSVWLGLSLHRSLPSRPLPCVCLCVMARLSLMKAVKGSLHHPARHTGLQYLFSGVPHRDISCNNSSKKVVHRESYIHISTHTVLIPYPWQGVEKTVWMKTALSKDLSRFRKISQFNPQYADVDTSN